MQYLLGQIQLQDIYSGQCGETHYYAVQCGKGSKSWKDNPRRHNYSIGRFTSIIFVDLHNMQLTDNTKDYNVNDIALIDTANIRRETFRESDIIARIGGDEFVIISIETHKGRADIIEARLRESIRIHNAERSRRYKLSMSVGISYYDPENPVSLNELLSSADKKMYEQKRDVNESSL